MTTTTDDDGAGGREGERAVSVLSDPPIQKKKRLSRKDRKVLKRKRRRNHKKKNREGASAAEASVAASRPSSSSRAGSSSEAAGGPSRAEIFGDGGEGGGGSTSNDDEEEDYASGYVPVPIPDAPPPDDDDAAGGFASPSSSSKTKTLGKWFPNAVTIKCSSNYSNVDAARASSGGQNGAGGGPKASLLLFYRYAVPPFAPSQVRRLATYLTKIAETRSIGGWVRISAEGLNCTLSSVDSPASSAAATLRHFSMDLRRFSPTFGNTDFKYVDDLPPDRHFKDWKLLPVKELVHYGLTETEAPLAKGGVHVDPTDYHRLLERNDAVVVDVRNHYEAVLGRFDGQTDAKKGGKTGGGKDGKEGGIGGDDGNADREDGGENDGGREGGGKGGAEYVDPMMRKSTDFPSWVRSPATRQKLANKTVLMYCTGGVRCERASAYVNAVMGEEVNGVYQLRGGIERYLKRYPDGGHWRGKNFVFDKREAVGVGDAKGDGGVVVAASTSSSVKRKNAAGNKRDEKERKDETKAKESAGNGGGGEAKCCVCSEPWDRYVGKKKCRTCGVPVLMCDSCMSLKLDKRPGMELRVRCPLCVRGNVTVFNESVEWTENGVVVGKVASDDKDGAGTAASSTKPKDAGVASASDDADAATTHEPKEPRPTGSASTKNLGTTTTTDARATNSKAAKIAAPSVLKWGGGHAREKKRKRLMKRTLCRFGVDCFRKDCFFGHPEREGTKEDEGTKFSKRKTKKKKLE